jgi:hypothetical protein
MPGPNLSQPYQRNDEELAQVSGSFAPLIMIRQIPWRARHISCCLSWSKPPHEGTDSTPPLPHLLCYASRIISFIG